MKTTVLKRKALVLSMAMAFIGAMTLTQCKKEKPTVTPTEDPTEIPTDTVSTPEGETVHITLKVNQGNDEKLDVNPPHVYFETGDVILVGSGGKYVGTLQYNSDNSVFSGPITGATPNQKLYFYLLGNRTPAETLTAGSTTSCSVNIWDQSSTLPVVSCAPSNENYTGAATNQEFTTTNFTAILHNKCALVKFDVIPTTLTSNIILSGVKNVVTVNFNPTNEEGRFAYSESDGGGSITVGKRTDGHWAILLPHDGEIAVTASAGSFYPVSVTIPTINNNAYLSEGITVDFTTTNTSHTITVSANPSEYGSVSGSGDYLNGQSCTVTATPAEGYVFENWTENDEVVVDNEGNPLPASFNFVVTSNRTLVANFIPVPEGTIGGLFTINGNGDQVYFSQGNLQWSGNNGWRFALHQYDFIGNAANNTSPTASNDNYMDLFCWGATGLNGVAPNTTNSYYTGGNNLSGVNDWGSNAIINGGNTTNSGWYTLSIAEWHYLFFDRTDANNKFGLATVNGVCGIIILPDDYSGSNITPFDFDNYDNNSWSYNVYSGEGWIAMENSGVVFLPAAGFRNGTNFFEGLEGIGGSYWSSTSGNGDDVACCTVFNVMNFIAYDLVSYVDYHGMSVRLVRNANSAK